MSATLLPLPSPSPSSKDFPTRPPGEDREPFWSLRSVSSFPGTGNSSLYSRLGHLAALRPSSVTLVNEAEVPSDCKLASDHEGLGGRHVTQLDHIHLDPSWPTPRVLTGKRVVMTNKKLLSSSLVTTQTTNQNNSWNIVGWSTSTDTRQTH